MNRRTRNSILLAAAFFFAAAGTFAQMPQIFEDFGVGPRDAGMGNTGVASANDYAAAFYNPAALVRAKGLQFNVGYKLIYPYLFLDVGKYGDRKFTQYPETNLVLIGFSWNLRVPKLIDPKYTERITIALALAMSDFYKSFTVYADLDTPFFFRYHDRALNLLSVYFSMSVRITDWLSIGGGVVPAPTDTWTRVYVDSTFSVAEDPYEATQGTVTRAYGKIEPVLGFLLRFDIEDREDAISFGATWRDEVSSNDGRGTATDFTKVEFQGRTFHLPPSDTPILTLTGWTPMQVLAGLSGKPVPGLTITAEAMWKRWSRWKNFFIRHPEPRFHDTWNWRAGAEYAADTGVKILESYAVRAGAYRELSPVPPQNGETNYLDPEKWVFTLGFDTAWTFGKLDVFRVPLHFAVAGQWHVLDYLHLHNEQDPDYGPMDAWGHVFGVTATIGVTAF